MILSIDEQIDIFILVFSAGIISGIIYDLLEILRMNIKHCKAMIYTEDIIYWIVIIVLLFLVLLDKNYAEIRFFNIAGFFSGMIVYGLVFSKIIKKIIITVLKWIKCILNLLFEIIMTPLRLIWIIIGKPVMTVGNFTKGYLKKLLHLCDYYAKINKKKLSAQIRFIRRKKDKTES